MLFIAKLIFSVLFSILLYQQTIKENFSLFVGFAIFSLILLQENFLGFERHFSASDILN
jgi:hypothetical protein